ncbi:hypothetical protein NL676_000347 [Syzygium grande]|nr:hypothetical protein NL676_000347 [Syzygium grande]
MSELRITKLGSILGQSELIMDDPPKCEPLGANAGHEEEREGEEVGMGPITGHEVKVGDCSMEVADIKVGDQATIEEAG